MAKKKIRVAILGGSFDPVTNAHIQVAMYVFINSDFDEVWLMPSYKNIKTMVASPEHRISMCRKATKDLDGITVCTYEIDNELEGVTVNVFKRLNEDGLYKDTHDFSMIIGMDQANNIESWVDYDVLKKTISFVVIPRKGYRKLPTIDWYLKKPHTYLNKGTSISEISSTKIRFAARYLYADLQSEEYINTLEINLNKEVLSYIEDNNLYE